MNSKLNPRIVVSPEFLNVKADEQDNEPRTYLRELYPGESGYIVGYDKTRLGYQGKLVSMGLTPGEKFRMIKVASAGEPIVIEVRGAYLSLGKPEADVLVVEESDC